MSDFTLGGIPVSAAKADAQGITAPSSSISGFFTGDNLKNYNQYKDKIFASKQQEIARQFNSAEAQKNREFQERLSNTAISRRLADLKKSGLNPILAASGQGASSPAGNAASGSGASAPGYSQVKGVTDVINSISGMLNSASKLGKNKVIAPFLGLGKIKS